jgi:hypothetical protein
LTASVTVGVFRANLLAAAKQEGYVDDQTYTLTAVTLSQKTANTTMDSNSVGSDAEASVGSSRTQSDDDPSFNNCSAVAAAMLSKSPPPLPPPGFGTERDSEHRRTSPNSASASINDRDSAALARERPSVPKITLTGLVSADGGNNHQAREMTSQGTASGFPQPFPRNVLTHMNSSNSLMSAGTSPAHSTIFSDGSNSSSARSDLTSSSYHPTYRSVSDCSPAASGSMKFFGDSAIGSGRGLGGLPSNNAISTSGHASKSGSLASNSSFLFDWTPNAIFADGDILGGSLMSSVDDVNDDFVAAANELKTLGSKHVTPRDD